MKLIYVLLLLAACSQQAPIKVEAPVVVTTPTVIPTPVPVPVVVPAPVADLSSLTSLAEKSSCAAYKWKDRGTAPLGYIKGMALAYAREVCFPSKAVNAPLGASDKDVLVHYGLKAEAVNVYAIMMGSGMRESSGKYCEGRDMSANNVTSSSCEAGMFQTSFNSKVSSPELLDIFEDFKNNKHNCLDVFKEKVTCRDMSNYGTGDGLKFQQMAKDCPAFAVSYAAVTFRTLYKHYGPLIKRAAEYRSECVDMLTAIEIQVKARPELCPLLK